MDAFFVFFADMVCERDVELCLHLQVAFPMPLRESEERAVTRMVREGCSERMTCREVDTQILEPREQFGVVRVEQVIEVHSVRISAPFKKECYEVQSPGTQGQIKGRPRLLVRIVSVCKEQQDQGMVSRP